MELDFAASAGRRASINPLALFDAPPVPAVQQLAAAASAKVISPRRRSRGNSIGRATPPKARPGRPQRTLELEDVVRSDLCFVAFDEPLAAVLQDALVAGDTGATLLAMVYAMMSSAPRPEGSAAGTAAAGAAAPETAPHAVLLAGISGTLIFHYDAAHAAVASPFTESSTYYALQSPELVQALRERAQPIEMLFASLTGVARYQMAVCWKTRGVFLVPTIYVFRWRPDAPGAEHCVPPDYPVWTENAGGAFAGGAFAETGPAHAGLERVPAHAFWARFVQRHGFGGGQADAPDCGNVDANIVAHARSAGLHPDIVFEKFKVNLLNQPEAPTKPCDVHALAAVAGEYSHPAAQLEALLTRPPVTRIDQAALSPGGGSAAGSAGEPGALQPQTIIHALLDCFVARETHGPTAELGAAALFVFAYKYGLVVRKSTFYIVSGAAGEGRPRRRNSRKAAKAPQVAAEPPPVDEQCMFWAEPPAQPASPDAHGDPATHMPGDVAMRPHGDAMDLDVPAAPPPHTPDAQGLGDAHADDAPGSPDDGRLGGPSSSPAHAEQAHDLGDDTMPGSTDAAETANAAAAEATAEEAMACASATELAADRGVAKSEANDAAEAAPEEARPPAYATRARAPSRDGPLVCAVGVRSPFRALCAGVPYAAAPGDLVSSVVGHICDLFCKTIAAPLPNVAERPRLAAIAEAINVLGVFKRPVGTHQFAADDGPRTLAAWVEAAAAPTAAAKRAPKLLCVSGRCRDLGEGDLWRCRFAAAGVAYALVAVVCTERDDVLWANRSRTSWSFHAQDHAAHAQHVRHTLAPADERQFLGALAAHVAKRPALYVLARMGESS